MFDYIPSRDNNNPAKSETLSQMIERKTPHAIAYEAARGRGARRCVMSRYGDMPDVITTEWCKAFASEASNLTGAEIIRIEVVNGNKEAIFAAQQNRLLIRKDGISIYLNDNGVITHDSEAIIDG